MLSCLQKLITVAQQVLQPRFSPSLCCSHVTLMRTCDSTYISALNVSEPDEDGYIMHTHRWYSCISIDTWHETNMSIYVDLILWPRPVLNVLWVSTVLARIGASSVGFESACVRQDLRPRKKLSKQVPGWKFETLKHARDLNTPVSPVSNARAYMLNASLSENLRKGFSISKQCLVRMKSRFYRIWCQIRGKLRRRIHSFQGHCAFSLTEG